MAALQFVSQELFGEIPDLQATLIRICWGFFVFFFFSRFGLFVVYPEDLAYF